VGLPSFQVGTYTNCSSIESTRFVTLTLNTGKHNLANEKRYNDIVFMGVPLL
jgi:hypothetical protein